MNELLSLFAVLLLVYVLQCISAAPAVSVVFRIDSRLRGNLVRHSLQVGRSQFRLFLINPFFPFSTAAYADWLPFSFLLDHAGRICGVDFATCLGSRSPTFDQHHSFASRAKKLFLDDSPVATLHSECTAAELAVFLDQLQSLQPSKRQALLDRELRRRFAFNALRERLELFSKCTALLNSMCISLFLFLFLIAPGGVYMFGLGRVWPALLLTLVLSLFSILWAFRRARRRLYPRRKDRDLQHLLAIVLSPFAAIRAVDPLAADLLEGFHPVAVACALLRPEDFVQFAGRELRRIKFATNDTILETAIRDFLLTQKVDPQSLLKPPTPIDVYSRTYCPICLTQYVIEEGACNDCGGVPLKLLA
jgi:hypothetical protein